MTDPFRGEVCAAWIDFLTDQEPEVLLEAMAAVAEACKDTTVRDRTRDVYLFDLVFASDPTARTQIPYPGAM